MQNKSYVFQLRLLNDSIIKISPHIMQWHVNIGMNNDWNIIRREIPSDLIQNLENLGFILNDLWAMQNANFRASFSHIYKNIVPPFSSEGLTKTKYYWLHLIGFIQGLTFFCISSSRRYNVLYGKLVFHAKFRVLNSHFQAECSKVINLIATTQNLAMSFKPNFHILINNIKISKKS